MDSCNGHKLIVKTVIIMAEIVTLTIGSIIDKDIAVDCVISTPVRLISTISSGKIDFAKVEVLVMDEGDKLFEDGFIEQVFLYLFFLL